MPHAATPSPNPSQTVPPPAPQPFDQPLPARGAEATGWLLATMFPRDKILDAWVTAVHDVDNPSEWQGGRLSDVPTLDDGSAAVYVSIGTVKPGNGCRRTEADIDAVAALVLDDVGDTSVNPHAKVDIGWLDLAPEPTATVETSDGNLQVFWVFEKPISRDDYRVLVDLLLLKEGLKDGIKDGTSPTRYVRLPEGINVKSGKNRFPTRLVEASGKKYTIDDLQKGFGLYGGHGKSNGAARPGSPGSGGTALAEALRLDDPDEALRLLEEILELCPNNNIGRDEWIGIVFGVWNASGHNEASHDLVVRWTASRQDGRVDEAKDLRDVWECRHSTKAGLTSLLRLLEKQDSDPARAMLDRIRSIQAKGAFAGATGAPQSDDEQGTGKDPAAAANRWSRLREVLASWPSCTKVKNAGSGNVARLPSGLAVFGKGAKTGPARQRQFITNRHARGIVSVMSGIPGQGKSAIALTVMNAIASERPDLAGLTAIERAGACVYIAADSEKADEFKRRDEAFRQHHKLTSLDYKHDIIVLDEPGALVERVDDALVPSPWLIRFGKLLAEIREAKKLAVITIDTLSGVAGGGRLYDEADMQALMDVARIMAHELNCAVDLINHLTKSGAKADPTALDASAGARSLTAIARFATNVVAEANGVRLIETKGSYRDGPSGMNWLEWKEVLIPVEVWDEGVMTGSATSAIGILLPVNDQAVQIQREKTAFDAIVRALQAGVSVIRSNGAKGGGKSPRQAGRIVQEAINSITIAEAERLVDILIQKDQLAITSKKEKNGKEVDLLKLSHPTP